MNDAKSIWRPAMFVLFLQILAGCSCESDSGGRTRFDNHTGSLFSREVDGFGCGDFTVYATAKEGMFALVEGVACILQQ